jgi:rubrerythrin
METRFNIFEILEIAEQIERNGAKFYLKTADLFRDPELRDLYIRLASWRAKHMKIWARMRKRFSDKTGEFGTFDPDNYVLSNPEVMAGLAMFGTDTGSGMWLTGRESKQDIIRDAIRRTNDVIIFYRGLKDFARDQASEQTIEDIIKEERRHIRMLNDLLQEK